MGTRKKLAQTDEPAQARRREEAPLVLQGLRKSFNGQKVLNGIDLTAKSGEAVAVLGRSGSGKSVLLKLIVGLQTPDAGFIGIHGQELTGLEGDRQTEGLNEIRKKIGFLFQQGALYDSLNIRDNVEFPLRRHSKLSGTERRERALDLLDKVGMERDAEKMPSEISGGMQKRVGLARALALDPDILLLDEPTAGLDPITATEISKLISELQAGGTITSIVVTHDLHSAKLFCDRFLLMKNGRVLVDGSFEDLGKSRDPFAVEFLREAPR